MTESKNSKLNDTESHELILWLLNRYDTYRGSVSNRAAILLSADAIILTGIVFLLDKMILSKNYQGLDGIFIISSTVFTIILLMISIVYATTSIINVWKPSKRMIAKINVWKPSKEMFDKINFWKSRKIMFGKDLGNRLFFHPTDTVEAFKNFSEFKNSFVNSNKDSIFEYALGELWTVTFLHYIRYQSLRKAIRFFIFSIFTFLISILFVIFSNINKFFTLI